MWEKTLTQRFILIGAVLLIGIWFIYPPEDKLRGGLDIEGGVSMIFEIEEEEGVSEPYLAEQMKSLLQKRVLPVGRTCLSSMAWYGPGVRRWPASD